MRNDFILTVNELDETTETRYIIPQRGADEIENFNVWAMEKPGFHTVKRPLNHREHSIRFTYQSIWLECYYNDPDGKRLLFKFIASNDYETNSKCAASVLDGDNLVLPEFRFSINEFDLDKLFALQQPIVELYQVKTEKGKEYQLQLTCG